MCDRAARAIVIVLASGAVACSVPEPGAPVLSPTPLFPRYHSYRTFDDVRSTWTDRTPVTVLVDQKNPARGGCPRFDALTVEVPVWDEQQSGVLTLTFINDRLESTAFHPKDFEAYIQQLQHRGVLIDRDRQARAEPATTIWITDSLAGKPRRFVGWRDERFSAQVNAWIKACS